MRDMAITQGDSVTIEYVGRLADGMVFDTSDEQLAEQSGLAEENPERIFEPLTVDVGEDTIIPGLQEALRGMEAGDETTVTIPPEQAYGEHTEERIGEYDRQAFEEMIGDRELREGFEVETDDGLPGRVVEFDADTVRVDFNHELAGETLTFEIRILDVE
jgi:FKBP-type peptidyl-prolyl cis-trans isomerase 2